MKLLMFHAEEFWYRPFWPDKPEAAKTTLSVCLVVFIHVEEADKEKVEVVDKAVGNIRWLSNKNKVENVVLHSFAHLSSSKSDPETASEITQKIAEKLKKGLNVHTVPSGQFYEFSIHVLGPSLAKVFKEV
ncbi:MAG: hypothetical protein A2Z77_08465 [Chloroflexi bacterium RBG_13_51_36]|nr:MAG: hypothetical protein A2Z77_08465 [Chloroflexi bacterium RBG_13_51_36]